MQSDFNYSYYPIIFTDEVELLRYKNELEKAGILGRRYFYPSLNHLTYTQGKVPISESISKCILCLPLYHDLSFKEQALIARVLLKT